MVGVWGSLVTPFYVNIILAVERELQRNGYQLLVGSSIYEEGTGAVLLGEVSQCNDDNTDNRFNPPVGRFPTIEEDEPPYRLLCNEYPRAK